MTVGGTVTVLLSAVLWNEVTCDSVLLLAIKFAPTIKTAGTSSSAVAFKSLLYVERKNTVHKGNYSKAQWQFFSRFCGYLIYFTESPPGSC